MTDTGESLFVKKGSPLTESSKESWIEPRINSMQLEVRAGVERGTYCLLLDHGTVQCHWNCGIGVLALTVMMKGGTL